MAQSNDGGTIGVATSHESYSWDESFVTSSTYEIALTIDAMKIRESTIQFINKGTGAVTYKIFGSAKKGQKYRIVNPETDDAWINLLSSGTYDHATETSIPDGDRAFETFSNPWRYLTIMIKATSGTPTVKIWHRGEN
jgi:hypothetical protein